MIYNLSLNSIDHCSNFSTNPGLSLKKKQMWVLEPAEKDLICFKSHLEKYISVDQVRKTYKITPSICSNDSTTFVFILDGYEYIF